MNYRIGWQGEMKFSFLPLDLLIFFGLKYRKILGNREKIPHLPSIHTRYRQVVHRNLNSALVVLGSPSHYHRPSLLKRSRLRYKIRGNEPIIDLFGYPTSPQTEKAFRARLKTLVRIYFRNVHLP